MTAVLVDAALLIPVCHECSSRPCQTILTVLCWDTVLLRPPYWGGPSVPPSPPPPPLLKNFATPHKTWPHSVTSFFNMSRSPQRWCTNCLRRILSTKDALPPLPHPSRYFFFAADPPSPSRKRHKQPQLTKKNAGKWQLTKDGQPAKDTGNNAVGDANLTREALFSLMSQS